MPIIIIYDEINIVPMFILAVYKWCYFHYGKFIIISSTVSWSWQNKALLCKSLWGRMPSDPLVWVCWTFPLYEKSIINRCKVTIIVSLLILKFGSYTALSSSSLWLKHRNLSLSRLRSVSDSISAIEASRCRLCMHYIDDLFNHMHASLQLCNYWGYGQVFHKRTKQTFLFLGFSASVLRVWISDCIALRLDNSNCFISAICTEIFYQQKSCHSIIHVHAMRKKSHHMVL